MVWFRNIQGGQIYWQADENNAYVFVNKNGLSLAQIPDEFVEKAIEYRCGCSDCNSRKQCLVRATETEIQIWQNV